MTGRPLPELIALVDQSLADLPAGDLTQAITDAEAADRRLNETLAGTNNPTAHEAISASIHGQEHLEAARVLLEIVRAELDAYRYDITGTSSPGTAQGQSGPMPRWTQVPDSRQKTHGRWIDQQGNVHTLMSGQHDQAFQNANERARELGLIKNTGNRIFSAAVDVELKFAVGMKPNERAVIVINNSAGPCANLYGCDRMLPYFLPTGARLTGYWPGGKKTYQGKAYGK